MQTYKILSQILTLLTLLVSTTSGLPLKDSGLVELIECLGDEVNNYEYSINDDKGVRVFPKYHSGLYIFDEDKVLLDCFKDITGGYDIVLSARDSEYNISTDSNMTDYEGPIGSALIPIDLDAEDNPFTRLFTNNTDVEMTNGNNVKSYLK